MSTEGINPGRRRFLTVATSVVGGVGAAAMLIPFVASMKPSARAQAAGAPVEAEISKMEPGQRITIEWRGKPIWIVRRTDEMLASLEGLTGVLRDPASEQEQQPAYARNEHRSLNPEFFVVIGICTHLGCVPTFRPEVAPADLGAEWKGGFFCPCHGSRFDIAGRVYQGVPAPLNLVVPPHSYVTNTRVLIGADEGAA